VTHVAERTQGRSEPVDFSLALRFLLSLARNAK
jgi:hypothetical protein